VKRIVVVEDSPTQAARLRSLLERNEWTVRLARSGDEGLRAAEEERPDVVLSDIVMPGMDGFELCRALAAHSTLHDVPVVLLTSLRAPADVVHALAAGAANFVNKPYDDDELLSRLLRTVERRAGYREVEILGAELPSDVPTDRVLAVLVSALEDARRRADQIEASRKALAASEAENRRLYEEALRASRAKDEFLAVVSHELRTPLSAIAGWARLLRDGRLDESGRARALETIERNAFAQARLIDDVLDVSRIIAGKLTVDKQRVAIEPIVENVVASFEPAVATKGLRLERKIAAQGAHVLGDPLRIAQVVTNLMANAVKFTDKGGTVEIRLSRDDGGVQLDVRDEGIGIASEFLPHVFERFRQGDASATRRHGGLGLGLAISRTIVEMHGGSIHAESEGSGRGATFCVKLPAVDVERADKGTSRRDSGGPEELTGVRVLGVDDDGDARDLMQIILEQHGAEAVVVGSGSDAMAELARQEFDVFITDIGMPEEDGISLLRRIRKEMPERAMATVALTAFGGDESERSSREAGFDVHVTKPVRPPEIVSAIARARRRALVRTS
jgi:signal transduction histidine kinase